MDGGCILLENFKEPRSWDIGQSLGTEPNKYFIGYIPSTGVINLIKILDDQKTQIVNYEDINDVEVQNIIKSVGQTRFDNLKTTIKNIVSNKIINVDKCQLPAIKLNNNNFELDYQSVSSQIDNETKSLILNILLKPFLKDADNINVLINVASVIA